MGDVTGIAWTDSTMNWWEGCTKVGPGCDHCYAETRDKRYHAGAHWGAGAPRRQMSQHTRNNPMRWQKNAAEFQRLRGHPQRVFASSLSDMFDNEVPDAWRAEAFAAMEATPGLRWQICTKRISNLPKMVPARWRNYDSPSDIISLTRTWPRNVGVLITTVTPEEIARDVPRLVDFKRRFGIPWVGLSIEPMIADVAGALLALGPMLREVDWAIMGGESGPDARRCELLWITKAVEVCKVNGVAPFVKQLGARCYVGTARVVTMDPAGKDPAEWPVDQQGLILTREFPEAQC